MLREVLGLIQDCFSHAFLLLTVDDVDIVHHAGESKGKAENLTGM